MRLLPAWIAAFLAVPSAAAWAQTTCAGCSGRVLPVGGRAVPVGETTFRVGMTHVSGDRTFKGSDELSVPPASADIEWNRQIVSLEVFHQFTRTLGAGVTLPYYEQDVENRATGADLHASGWGDTSLYALWTPWLKDEDAPVGSLLTASNLTIYGGMSIPTGDPLEGEIPGLHNYHLGSGSVEFKLGLRYWADATDYLRLFGAAVTVIDGGADSSGFQYGKSYELQLGASVSPIQDLWVYAEGIAVVREKDRQGSLVLDNTGGTWWYVEMGAGGRVVDGVSLEGSVTLPVYWNVNGIQPVSDAIYSIGIRYRF